MKFLCASARVRWHGHGRVLACLKPYVSSVQRACAILTSVASLAPAYFSALSHKRHNSRKKVSEDKKCNLIFSKTLSETFLILKIIQRDIVVSVKVSSCKAPVILVGF